MFIDTHIHESKFSPDSYAPLSGILEQARKVGLDAICITDHDNNQIRHEARALSAETGYLIIPGCEILTYEGDIVVFGVDELPEEKVHAAELLTYINAQGGVGISAHPFRTNNRGLGEGLRSIVGLAGVEGFNGNTDLEHNLQACQLAGKLGLPLFGASDSHQVAQVGKYATWFPDTFSTEEEFVAAIRAGKMRPAISLDDGFTLLDYVRE